MNIAIDARELEGNPTGAGRVLFELLKRLKPEFLASHKIHLYFKREIPQLSGLPEANFEKTVLPAPPFLNKDIFWEQILLPQRLKKDGIDLFWGANGASPMFCPKKTRVWVTLYDLTYFMDAAWYGSKERKIRQWRSRMAAFASDRIFTSSEASKADIRKYLHKEGEHVTVLYLGSDAMPAPNKTGDVSSTLDLLYVGSILNRRPVEHMITAVSKLENQFPELRLRIIGDDRTHPRKDLHGLIRRLGLSEKVKMDGYVSDTALTTAYQQAAIFCFPSLYEGFGLPVLEAQRRGIPVITLQNSSLAEIGADSVCYAASADADSWAQAVRKLILEPEMREALRQKGLANAQRYTWDRFATQWQSWAQSDTMNA